MPDIQAAKEYLSQIQKTDRLINRLISTVSTLRSGLTSQSYDLKPDKVQNSGPKDPLAEVFARIDELERQINTHIDELIQQKQETYDRIHRLPDLDQQNILIARYIEGMKWENVAVEVHLSIRQIGRIHQMALIAFAEVNKDVLECPTCS